MARQKNNSDAVASPPFETEDLRKNLVSYLDTPYSMSGSSTKIGDFRWGVYAFYDYDGEPIYVGQTNERVRTRIRRHLTNQRTDAVAMSVLDPFEVLAISVWPLPQYQTLSSANKSSAEYVAARQHLNSLELYIYQQALKQSKFGVVLNEKDPPQASALNSIPDPLEGRIVSPGVFDLRSHPDFRVARRALVIARLAQVISERKVQGGLRRVMLAQAKRLEWLANRRFEALGGASSVEKESEGTEELGDD